MFTKIFPAFKYSNYRIYFAAQIVSLIGTWMQQVAQGYLIFQLTHSAFLVGIVAALGTLPTTFLSLIGGTLVDKLPRKKLLITTTLIQLVLGVTFGILVIIGKADVILIGIFALLMGTVNAVDQPARMSNVAFLVTKEHIHAAQAMNMATFNSARVVGPAIAGWLIYAIGVGYAFLFNGLSYIAPLIAYKFIDFGDHIPKAPVKTWDSIKEGLSYVYNHNLIKTLLIYMVIIAIFGWSYTTLLPVLAERVFNQGAQGLGVMFSAAGSGSIIGALTSAVINQRLNPNKTILIGGIIFGLSLIGFASTTNFNTALFFLFTGGFGMLIQNVTIQASIQKNVEDHIRGRVASIQALAFIGMTPFGSLQIGYLADHFNSQIAITFCAIIVLMAGIFLHFKLPKKF